MHIREVLPLVSLSLVCPVIGNAGRSLSEEDTAKIKRVHSKYEEAWLKGDADGVRSLFTADCVLLPPHGDKPRIGQKGLNEYWFSPDAPLTQITKLVVTPQNSVPTGRSRVCGGRTKWPGRRCKTARRRARRTKECS